MTGADVVSAARACLDTPFRHQGRIAGTGPGAGLDCAGLVVVVAEQLGIAYAAPTNYPRHPVNGELVRTLDAQASLQRVDAGEMAAGDILVFRLGGQPRHLGIWTGDTLIHAFDECGKVVEHQMDATWRRMRVRTYRFREVAA